MSKREIQQLPPTLQGFNVLLMLGQQNVCSNLNLVLLSAGQFASHGNVCIFPPTFWSSHHMSASTIVSVKWWDLCHFCCIAFGQCWSNGWNAVAVSITCVTPFLNHWSSQMTHSTYLIYYTLILILILLRLQLLTTLKKVFQSLSSPYSIHVNSNSEGASYTQHANSEQFNDDVSTGDAFIYSHWCRS